MVDGTVMASGGGMMLGSGACEVGTGGVCTIAAAPAFATGAILAGAGAASMVSHTGMYAEAQQQYMQSRAKENAGSSKTQAKSEPAKPKSPEDLVASKTAKREVVRSSNKSYSEATFQTFQKQLEQHGESSIIKSRSTIEKRLNQHLIKLDEIKKTGGHTSSVEREIMTFKNQLQAIDDLFK